MLTFKKEHPFQYWARLFLFAYCVVTLSIFGFVQADTISSGTGHEYQSDSGTGGTDTAAGCRQMNGTLWYFTVWRNPADTSNRELRGYYSSDNASTWSSPIVIYDDSAPGFNPAGYPNLIFDAVALSNNSIVVYLNMYYHDSVGKLEMHVFSHWNNSDLTQWERTPVCVDNSVHFVGGRAAVNSTDIVLLTFHKSGGTDSRFYHFDPSDRSVTDYDRSNANPYLIVWALVNETDQFLFAYELGATNWLYVRTADATQTLIYSASLASPYHCYDVVMNVEGTLLYIRALTSGAGLYLNYWNTTDSGAVDVTTKALAFAKIGLNNLNDTFVTVMGYDQPSDKFYWVGDRYYHNAAHWQETQSEIFDETDDTTSCWISWTPHQIYPISVNGSTTNHTQLPHGYGLYLALVEYDVGASNYDNWEIHHEALIWPGIANWTFDPTWVPPEEPDDDEEEPSALVDVQCVSGGLIVLCIIIFLMTLTVAAFESAR